MRAISEVRVHPRSGDLLVGGESPHAWLGREPVWRRPLTNRRAGAFWGTDDWFIGTGPDGRQSLLDLRGGSAKVLRAFAGMMNSFFSVSANGQVALLGTSRAVVPYLLLSSPGEACQTLAAHPTGTCMLSIQLAPDGRRLAGCSEFGSSILVHQTATGTCEAELAAAQQIRANDVAWIDGGNKLLSLLTMQADRGSAEAEEWVAVWDVATRKLMAHVRHPSPMDVLAVSPDGLRFAEAGTDKWIRVRDCATLAVVQEFRAHDGDIAALAWHPRLPVLASASLDLTVRIWDLNAGACIELIPGLASRPIALSFSPSGKRLTCSDEQSMQIWEMRSGEEPRVSAVAKWRE